VTARAEATTVVPAPPFDDQQQMSTTTSRARKNKDRTGGEGAERAATGGPT
jgi:hypothetical protein